jgi:hypothetical protein
MDDSNLLPVKKRNQIFPIFLQSLAHPIVLLCVGAAISGYLIPYITRQWQDHQKELEVKIGLVSQISDSVTTLAMIVQFTEIDAKGQIQEDFIRENREWEIKRAVIGSQLLAYFPGTQIGHDWDIYSNIVAIFSDLTKIIEEERRKKHLQEIQRYFTKVQSPIHWDINILSKREEIRLRAPEEQENYKVNWLALKQQILEQKNDFIQRILKSHISGF